jgi:hypothetical protein
MYEPLLTTVGDPYPVPEYVRRLEPGGMIPVVMKAGMQTIIMFDDIDHHTRQQFGGPVHIGAVVKRSLPIFTIAFPGGYATRPWVWDVVLNIYAQSSEESLEGFIEDFSNAFSIVLIDEDTIVQEQRVLGVDHSVSGLLQGGMQASIERYSSIEEIDRAADEVQREYPSAAAMAKACHSDGEVHRFFGGPKEN